MKRIRRILATAMSFMMCLTLLSNTAFAQGVTPLIDSSDDIVYVDDIEDEETVDDVELSIDEDEIVTEDVVIEDVVDESITDEQIINDEDAVEETDVDEASDDFDVEEYDVVDDSETDNEADTDDYDVTEEAIEADDSLEETIVSDVDEDESIADDVLNASDENEEPFVLSDDEELDEENKSGLPADDIETVEENEDVNSIEITETIVSSPEETSYTLENDSLDSDFLLEEYIDREIDRKQTPMFNSSSFNGNKLTGVNKKIYDKAKIVISEIANGDKERAVVSFTPEELGCAGEFTAADLGVSEIVDSSNHITTEAKNALKNKTGLNEFDFELLGETLRADCPYERYWMGLKASMTWFEVGASNEGGIWKLYYGSELEYKIQVSVDYQGADEFTVDTTKTGAVKSAINSINGILQTAESKDNLEKIEYFRDQICSLVSYNEEAATWPSNRYGDPWQLVYVFDGNPSTNVVCEGYSKAFMYLCNKTFFSSSSINCYVVSGEMDGEPHMWNIIHWSDNANYMVDVTNCDSLGRNNLFKAVSASGNVSDGYYFYSGIDNILYTYDPDTLALYSENELTIGSDIYGTLTKIFVNYDAYITGNKSVPFTVIKEGGSEDCQFRLDSAVNGSGDSILGASYNPTYGDENVFYITFPSQGKYTVIFSAKDTDGTVKTDTITVDVKKSLGITTYLDLVTELNNASTDENNPSLIQLGEDINTTAELKVKSGTYVILDLNGHIINRGGIDTSRVFMVEGNLTIIDSQPETVHNTENSDINSISGGIITGGLGTDGGAIYVSNTGSLVINGGTIAYNTGENGGGVYVKSGSFVMNGGNIYSNVANKSGGGVYLIYGKITISGGKISQNQTVVSNSQGGGVYVDRGNFFNMNGGEISENTAQSKGGGISVTETDFYLEGDSVIKNNYAGGGAGIYYSSFDYTDTFTISGDSSIEENHATKDTSYGGGIYIERGDLTLSGSASIKNNKAINTGGVYVFNGNIIMIDNASIDGNEADMSAGGVYCRKSVDMSGNASVKNNVNNGTEGAGGIWCTDFNISENATIYNNAFKTSNSSSSLGAGGIYLSSGTMNMSGGIISYNYSYGRGGGVYVGTGSLEISGGSIIYNDAEYFGGGGVYNHKGKIKISGNPVIYYNNLITDDIYDNNLYIGYREYDCCLYITGILLEDAKIGVSLPGGPSLSSPLIITTGDTVNNYGYSLYNSEDPNKFFISDKGYTFFVDTNGEVKALTPWMLVVKKLNNGETVVLDTDIKRTNSDPIINIDDNVTATLDLNGHIIDACNNTYAINLTEGVGKNITIIDSNPNTTHYPAIKYTDPVTNEVITVKGGIITGAVYGLSIYDGSTVTMKGGSIVGNNYGGIIYQSAIFNFEDGSVLGNNKGGFYLNKDGVLNMSGGAIIGNTCGNSGGGVYVANEGSFHLSGGRISNNTSNLNGAGINRNGAGEVYVSGNPIVLNNKKIVSEGGVETLVENNFNNIFTIEGEMTEGAHLAVGTTKPISGTPLKVAEDYNIYNNGKKASDYFTSIFEGCFLSCDELGDVAIYINNTVSFEPGIYGTGTMESLSNIGGPFVLPECEYSAPLGKRFKTWWTGNGDICFNVGEICNITGNKSFIAEWEDTPKHRVGYNANGGEIDENVFEIYEGSEYGEMPVPTYTGYVFEGWYAWDNGEKVNPTDIVTRNIYLVAHWSPAQDTAYKVEHYKEKIVDSEYELVDTDNLTGETLANVTPDVKAYVGFTAPSKQTVEIKADGSTVVQYKYTRNSYAITWNLNGGKASGNYSKGNVLYGSTITAPKPTKQGYTFNGWNVSVPSKMPAKELTFTAKWIARTDTVYKVEHYKQGLDGKYTASPVVEKFKGTTGASVKPAVKKYDGFKSPSVQTVKIKADGSLVVKYYYTRNTYLLKWNYDGGSASGSYTSGKVKYGTKITAPKPTKKGYSFNGWDATVSKTMPAKNVTYKAKWKINSYSLTWDLAGGTASNKYTSGNVKYNAKITAPIPEKEGYVFAGWSVSVPSNMPAKNLKITAKWREKTQEENVTDFVKRFYSVVLERPQEEIDADVEGIGYWVNRLITGVDDGANVAYGFVYSPEFQNKKVSDEEYVLILYHSFFGRDPFDPNNYDEDGYNYWLNKLKSGTDRMDVLAGFTSSAEFQNLCDKYNINRGKLVPSEKPSYRRAHNLP